MKQKYLILNNDDQEELIIREFADLEDKELLLLLGEEKYDVKAIKSAINKGRKALISVLRTENLYPKEPSINKLYRLRRNFVCFQGALRRAQRVV